MTCNSIWSVAQLDEIPTTRIKIPSFSWLTEESQCSVKWSEKSSHRCKPLVDLLKRVIKVNHTALPTLFKCNRGEIVKKQQHGTWMHTKVTHYSVCCRDCPTKLDQREKKTLYTPSRLNVFDHQFQPIDMETTQTNLHDGRWRRSYINAMGGAFPPPMLTWSNLMKTINVLNERVLSNES